MAPTSSEKPTSSLDDIPAPLAAAIQQARLQASDAAAFDFFGYSVAISPDGNTALVGANQDDNTGGLDAGSAYIFVPPPPIQPGQVIISEFRQSGANGATDEFYELYNNTDSNITVATQDGSAGWTLRSSDGSLSVTIPNGAVIPARGHYLVAHSTGYGLAAYATADQTFTADTPINTGIALFRTTNTASFTLAERLDAVGPTTEANTIYREGAGYAPLAAGAGTAQYTFFRDLSTGKPKDTNNNGTDLLLVSTNGSVNGVQTSLGAPGPENLASPIDRTAKFGATLLDTKQSSSNPPNRTRDLTSDPANCSQFGTMTLRRTFTNNTGAAVTRLRFRITILTTFPAPSGTADLRRARTIADSNVTVTGGASVLVRGTTLEQPPNQPNCGGINSSLALASVTTAPVTTTTVSSEEGDEVAGLGGVPAYDDTIGLAAPLAACASINVQFLLGVQQTGTYRFYINIEALP